MLVKSKLKYIQSLGQKKFRQQEGLFIAEGPKIVGELLEADPSGINEIFATKKWMEANRSAAKKTPVTEISEAELERMSQLSTPHEVLALVRQYPETEVITNGRVVLALDTIQDPGNLGTIIRIADWFGVDQVVCSQDSAEVYNPKVVQATMGSIARVRVQYRDLVEWLAGTIHSRVYATVMEGKDVTTMKKITEGIILIGNESKGLRPSLQSAANVRITIPRKGKAESLNAAVAAGIVLSYLVNGQ